MLSYCLRGKPVVKLSIAEKCFDHLGTISLRQITLLDVDVNFYIWDFRNLP